MTQATRPYTGSTHNSYPTSDTIDAVVSPVGPLKVLSKVEMAKLLDASQSGLYTLFRSCSLAVLNSGNYLDDGKELLERYRDFSIQGTSTRRTAAHSPRSST